MGMWIGRNRKARVTYGFDEIALVPGSITINPNEVDTTFRLPRRDAEPLELKIPILASAMDGVVDVRFCVEMGKLGGLGVINLEGVQTRYENPAEVLEKIVRRTKKSDRFDAKDLPGTGQADFIAARVRQIKDGGRARGRQFDSAKRGGIRRDCPGSRRRCFCRAKHGLNRPPHFHRNINRSTWRNFVRTCGSRSSSAIPLLTMSRLRSWGVDRPRFCRGRAGSGLHVARCARAGRAASHRYC